MIDETIYDLFNKQGQAIATMALRLTALESLLLEKKIVTPQEVQERTIELGQEFNARLQEEILKAQKTA